MDDTYVEYDVKSIAFKLNSVIGKTIIFRHLNGFTTTQVHSIHVEQDGIYLKVSIHSGAGGQILDVNGLKDVFICNFNGCDLYSIYKVISEYV